MPQPEDSEQEPIKEHQCYKTCMGEEATYKLPVLKTRSPPNNRRLQEL